jgi:hypothetical protein
MTLNRSPRRIRTNTSLRVETLEDRKLMAGNVLVNFDAASSTWRLVGDALSNNAQIRPSSTGPGLEVAGLGGTTLNGAATPIHLGYIDNLFANMGAGHDRLGITGAINDRDIGSIAAFMGDGNDRIDCDETYLRDNVIFGTALGSDRIVAHLQTGGNLTVNSGNGNDYVELSGNTGLALLADSQIDPAYVFGGAIGGGSQVNINTDLGHDTLIFNIGVDGNLRINTGAGNDYVRVWSTQVADSATILMDVGTDECSIESSPFSGNTLIRTGAGDDLVTVDNGTHTLSTGGFVFDGGIGADTLNRTGNIFGNVFNFETLV